MCEATDRSGACDVWLAERSSVNVVADLCRRSAYVIYAVDVEACGTVESGVAAVSRLIIEVNSGDGAPLSCVPSDSGGMTVAGLDSYALILLAEDSCRSEHG